MSNIVCVGLDQWVMTDVSKTGKNVGLFTDGLSGCVALILIGDNKACLSHVYSGLNQYNREQYEYQLDLAFVWMRREGGSVKRAALIASDPEVGTEKWRCETLQKYISDKSSEVKYVPIRKGASVLINFYNDFPEGWDYEEFIGIKRMNLKGTIFNTRTGRQHFTVYGRLPSRIETGDDGAADIVLADMGSANV